MEENYSQNKWSKGATEGLYLSLVAVVCGLVSQFIANTLSKEGNSSLGFSILSIAIWIAQTVGSIWLLSKFMKKYRTETGEKSMGYGTIVCLFSSIVCAIWSFACYQWIFPDMAQQVSETFESLRGMMEGLPAGTLDKMIDNFGQYMCITTFFKSFLFGVIAAAIISSSQQPKDIFADNGQDELL
ncbi:MAG: DUF4199 domain-containing protein [Bacteroidales bacterium]|nr:DUF4199 domain-containing protein [Bacteroidales bacterium]